MKLSNLENYFKNKERIFLIGKGSSLDQIDFNNSNIYNDSSLIININDSETVVLGSISIVSNDLTRKRLENGNLIPSASIYISNKSILNCNTLVIEKNNLNLNEPGLLISQILTNDIIFFDQAILTAIHISSIFARKFNKEYEIFLLGIDFGKYKNRAKNSVNNSIIESEDFSNKILNSQLGYLKLLVPNQKLLSIKIKHVGSSSISWINPKAFNKLFLSNRVMNKKYALNNSYQREKSLFDKSYQVKIIAELTTNHFGDKDRLFAMIEAAARSGADYIKLQRRCVDKFYSSDKLKLSYESPFGHTFRDYRLALELSDKCFKEIDIFCKKLNIGWFLSVLDIDSFNSLKNINPIMIKLPSTISEHQKYLEYVAKNYSGDLVISTGYTSKEYENFIINNFKYNKKIYLLHCTSAYPAPEMEANISVLNHYSEISKVDRRFIPGYSSHDIGSLCSQMAVASGAKMIEKHVKLGDVSWAHFDDVAVDLSDNSFKNFVEDIRRAERILGSDEKRIQESENHKYWL